MKLTFLGGADEVGASSTLIEIAGKKLLVDVGIRISNKANRTIESDQLPDLQQVTDVGGPDYILVTHAHTDHTGALPLVLEQYPQVPVMVTRPTAALIKVLQADAQYIMKSKQEEEGELPLFDEVAVGRLMDAMQTVEFKQIVHLGDGLQVTYHPAGHIVGAASLVIESEEGIVVMSGDLSMTPQRAVVRADLPRIKADFVVLESTYGGRLHANRAAEERRLVETLKRVIEREGKALIPAFALGRAQEVIQIVLKYRDELPNVPVWVDGMVRAVCRAYNTFPELLPQETVRFAGDDDIFFRKNVKAVKSPVQREELARAPGAAVIISSSGMLTGGPSAAYAKWLGPDERNGIFLTGYQDEEAPGRFVQRMVKERQEGQAVSFRIGEDTVSLRCELGTYSLSAHADEGELISIADAFGANDIALVHGDEGARHSLASKLRARDKRVRQPVSGTSIGLEFKKRPWAIGVKQGAQSKPLDPAELWESLKTEVGSFFSTADLSHAWWGTRERADEVKTVLEASGGVYFAQDWRKSTTFQVRKPEQVARSLRQRAIMDSHPNIIGQLVVLKDVNKRVRIGVVQEARPDSFKALMLKAKGQNYPADALVWAIAPMADFPRPEKTGLMKHLNLLFQQAEALRDTLMSFERRRELALKGEPVDPTDLIPEKLLEGVSRNLALLTIVIALAKDGAERTEDGKLTLQQAQQDEPMEMNLARKTALAAFPDNSRLRKVGMDTTRNRLNLFFDFPDKADELYSPLAEMVADQTGWEVNIMPDVNQQALGAALFELLPKGAQVLKGPSYFMADRQVSAEVDGVEHPEHITQQYEDLTGFTLSLNEQASSDGNGSAQVMGQPAAEQMEINQAYGVIREALGEHGLYKTSLKQGQIVLSFISPQVGHRHEETIAELAEKTGYPLSIHPHPNQNAIHQIVLQIAKDAGLQMRKRPGIHVDRGELVIYLQEDIDEVKKTQLAREFEEETGYQLVFDLPTA